MPRDADVVATKLGEYPGLDYFVGLLLTPTLWQAVAVYATVFGILFSSIAFEAKIHQASAHGLVTTKFDSVIGDMGVAPNIVVINRSVSEESKRSAPFL